MNNKELTPLELYKEFLNIIELPVKSHLLNSDDKETLERYRVLRTQIEDVLKEHENDVEIWKNYLKEIKNLPPIEVQMKLRVLEIIKDSKLDGLKLYWDDGMWFVDAPDCIPPIMCGHKKEDYDLLKVMLFDENN